MALRPVVDSEQRVVLVGRYLTPLALGLGGLAVVVLSGEAFPPLWLLLMLTPIATAVYGHPREAWITAVVAALPLTTIQVFRPGSGRVDYVARAARGGFIVLLSFLINAVSRHARE